MKLKNSLFYFSKFCTFVIRQHIGILLFGTLLSAVGGYYSIHLFSNLRTGIEELLPRDARSVRDLDEIQARLESTNNIHLLFFSKDTQASKKFVLDLAAKIDQLPSGIAAGTEYRIDRELKFFKDRRSLFIEKNDLQEIQSFIQKRIHYEIQLYNPLTILENRSFKEPTLDLKALQKKYDSRTDQYSRFPDGFYATPDETLRIMIVNLPGTAAGIEGSQKLRKNLDDLILKLDPKKYASDLDIKFSGGVQDLIEEHEALIEDLALSTILVCILVFIAMLIYFRSLVGTFSLVISLFIGTFWTFGVAFFEVGYLNANSAFMGSIVIGNGINFGIIFLARFMEERRRGHHTLKSIAIAIDQTLPATIVAALAAALAYGSLILTSFRGFRQFGIIGFTGMILCWIAAYTVLPAMMVGLHRIGFFRKPIAPARPGVTAWIAKLITLFPKTILSITAIITILSVISFSRFGEQIIETDLKKLRNKQSMLHGSMFYGKYVDEVFQRYLSPIVILPKNADDSPKIKDAIRAVRDQENAAAEKDATKTASFIVNVSTLEDFVPKEQMDKIKILNQISSKLDRKILYRMSADQRRMVDELLTDRSYKTFNGEDLPEMVRSKFRELDGTIGKLVLVEPSISSELARSQNLIHFVKSVREAADSVQPGVAVAGTLPVTSDLFESIVKDGPKATLFAFLAVFLLIVLLFRNIITIAQCSLALVLGVTWLLGYVFGFDQKINFLNFIALPITFGIGVDYGVNIFQRYQLEKKNGIIPVLQQTGGAVLLASLTTTIGYGSLLIASNQAFVSFGRLAILGEFTCVVVAVISLPTWIWYSEQRKKKTL
jgi:predicted RND superfamily exporter protein